MKFGPRTPSLNKAIAARVSTARVVRHSFRLKAPRGMGFLLSPRRASYNFFRSRATFPLGGMLSTLPVLLILFAIVSYWEIIVFIFWASVVAVTLVILALIWITHRNDTPPDIPDRIRLAETDLSKNKLIEPETDYAKWSKAKWKSWEKSHLQQIASGQKRERPEDISKWTKEERIDWQKEEWLRAIVKGRK